MAKTERRKSPGSRFTGPVVDTLTGINPNTRRAGEARGVLKPDEDGYDFEQLQRAAAWAEVARLGINSRGTRDYLLRSIVQQMRACGDDVPVEPRYLLFCTVPKVDHGEVAENFGPGAKTPWPPPVVKRMMHGGWIGLADGNGAAGIALDLSAPELQQHFEWTAKTDDVATLVVDTAGLQRRLLRRVAEYRRREESRP
jgi:hypothetical protein